MKHSRRNFLKTAAAGSAGTLMINNFSRSAYAGNRDSLFSTGEAGLTSNSSLSGKQNDKFAFLYPRPQMIRAEKGVFKIRNAGIYLSQSFQTNDSWILKELFRETVRISLLKENIDSPSILIGNITNEIIRLQANLLNPDIPGYCYKPEGYVLIVRSNQIIVAGGDDRGTFYGVQTLRQLIEASPSGNEIDCLTIFDWPSIPFRSVHYLHCDDLWRADKTKVNYDEELGNQVVKSMGRHKLNTLILAMGNSVRWVSHPEVSLPGAWSPDKFQDFVQFIRKHHIEIIPEFNLSPCHDSWLGSYHALVDKPVYFQTIQDIISEYIDLLDPRVRCIHLGADEESTWHNQNMKLDPAILRPVADRIESMCRYVRFLESKHVEAMIWADIILSDRPKGKWMWEIYDADTENARLMKEKVIHVDWFPYTHYGNFAITEELLKRNMRTVIASWYRSEKEAGFPFNVAKKAFEIKDRNLLGVMQTIWPVGMKLGDKPVYQAAGSFWNPGNPGLDISGQMEYAK